MWTIAGVPLTSRLLLGTAQYPSLHLLQAAVITAETNIITVSLKRQSAVEKSGDTFWRHLKQFNCHLLPNTAGCRRAEEAVTLAEMAREIFATNWIKLEVIGDDYNLQPDPFELVKAVSELVKRGFVVFPYCTDDFVLCQRLLDSGCTILMPWVAPIGSGMGIINPYAITTLRARLPNCALIIDAGIGKPSHAMQALEWGYDAVLVNSAVAAARDPAQITAQIAALSAALPPQAIKIGLLGQAASLHAVRQYAEHYKGMIVLDPVLWASSGHALFAGDTQGYQEALRQFLPRIDVFTPNLREAEQLLHFPIHSYDDMQQAAQLFIAQGVTRVH